jgi:hypothetical protein
MLDGLEIFFDLITFAYCLIMFLDQEEAIRRRKSCAAAEGGHGRQGG